MDKLMPIFEAFLKFLFQLFDNLKIFGEDSKIPGALNQYYEDGKTVAGAVKDAFGN